MGKNTKRELFLFAASDINAIEKHFEKMARKGWMLDKIGEYIVRYKKIEPQELKFSVDLFPKLSVFDYPDKDEVVEYRNLCIDAGWNFITASNKIQVFYSDRKDNLLPIQTDDRIKQTILNKSILFEIIIFAICLPIFILSLGKLSSLDYRIFNSNISMAIAMIGPIFIVPLVVYIFSDIIWILKAKAAVKREEPLPQASYKQLRVRKSLLFYPALILSLSIIIGLILDLLNGNVIGLLSILPTTIGLTVGYLFKKNKNKKKRSKEKNIGLFAFAIIVVLIIVNIVMPKLYNINESEELQKGYKGLMLSDFNLPSPSYTNFYREESIVFSKNSTYYETFRGNDGYYVRTNYIRTVNNRLAKYIFDGMIKEGVSKYNRIITPADSEYGYFDEAFFINYNNDIDNKGTVILLKGKEVFYIDSSLNLSDKDNVKIIINKLNNQ
ncbi:DUF2812 domain-containing protein [Tissierella carlieri]|jgi:hypothetical protein|uniref:DUF2812 domain-containing protein n=1 Tax=Tissierella carlieri TaxID=689904 RepID=UPI00386634A4